MGERLLSSGRAGSIPSSSTKFSQDAKLPIGASIGWHSSIFKTAVVSARRLLGCSVSQNLRLTQDDHDPIRSGYQFNLLPLSSHSLFVMDFHGFCLISKGPF